MGEGCDCGYGNMYMRGLWFAVCGMLATLYWYEQTTYLCKYLVEQV